MIRVLRQNDIKMLIELFKISGRVNKEEVKNIYYNMNTTKVVVGNIVDDRITSLLIANLINNEYYLEDIIFINNDINEIKEVLKYMIEVLRTDERGLSIIYDNIPYSEVINSIMLDCNFKCDYINFISEHTDRVELIRNRVLINDINDEVNNYMMDSYDKEYSLIKEYLGEVNNYNTDIDISKTNIVVAKDTSDSVIGLLRFGLITDSIYISNIYGDNDEVILDLINVVRNLTNRNIEIGIYPVRNDLINLLLQNGFNKAHADYKYKF